MHKNLQSISLRPLLAPVFFESFNDEYVLSDDDQDWIESSIKTLIPILPEYIRNIIPDRLLKDAPSFCQILTDVDLPTADFLIGQAPDHIFDFETFIFILDHFPSNEDIMLEILIHRKHLWSEHESLDNKTKSRLIHALENIFHCGVDFNEMLLPMVIAHQLFIPEHFEPECFESEHLEKPHARLIYMLSKHDMSVYEVAKLLAAQTASGDIFEADVIEPEIEIVQSRRLIPSIILTMLELSNARVLNDLLITLEICPVVAGCLLNAGDPRLEDMNFVIASIWNQRVGLDESSQWAFAVILLSAIKRCLSNYEIASLFSGHAHGSSHACLTEEAALLQKNSPKALLPVEEMLACLSSGIGMSEAHKKTSTAMLKHWAEN